LGEVLCGPKSDAFGRYAEKMAATGTRFDGRLVRLTLPEGNLGKEGERHLTCGSRTPAGQLRLYGHVAESSRLATP